METASSKKRQLPTPSSEGVTETLLSSAAEKMLRDVRKETVPAWASMRGSFDNRGRMQVEPELRDLPVRHWETHNAVFSTPVIGKDDLIYVGSADQRFYCFDPVTGETSWTFDAGAVIDSAACIGDEGNLFVPSGNGLLSLTPDGKERWRLDLLQNSKHFSPSTIYWFEGNAVIGPDGNIYAGCDDFHFYCIDQSGKILWKTVTGCCIWTAGCFDDECVYLASFDLHLYALDRKTGKVKWRRNTKNFTMSSPVLLDDGTLVFGSFDGNVYGFNSKTGRKKWRIPTRGHVIATPAVDDEGLLYIGSTDGHMYCIDPSVPVIKWSSYTGDAIRSSAAVFSLDAGLKRNCIVVGTGTGEILFFDRDGNVLWSYDTLQGETDKAHYRNINASIALGRWGLATASANGDVIFIPYSKIEVGRRPLMSRPASPEKGRHLSSIAGHRFRIEKMSIDEPGIVASFDQIGIASLTIEVAIVQHDAETGNVIGWGVQKFGIGEHGEPADGIPVPRVYFFAFEGRYVDSILELESRDGQFEITAFPVPLDSLHFTLSLTDAGARGIDMKAEVFVRKAVLRTVGSWFPSPLRWRGSGGRFMHRLRYLRDQFGAWFPEDDRLSVLREFHTALWRMAVLGFWFVAARIWRPWKLIDSDGRFRGFGTFSVAPGQSVSHEELTVSSFTFDQWGRAVTATFERSPGARGDACPGILLIDLDTNLPVACNYSLLMRTERGDDRVPIRTTLDLPWKLLSRKSVKAVVFVDLEERASLLLQ